MTDNRSRFKPNSMAVRFEVPTDSLGHLQLEVVPSFWVWAQRQKQDRVPWAYGDRLTESVWMPWDKRQKGPVATNDPAEMFIPKVEDTQRRPYVRLRYCQVFAGPLRKFQASVLLDLDKFRQKVKWVCNDRQLPPWVGHLEAQCREGTQPGRTMIELRLVNDFNQVDQGRESAWFDVRMRLRANVPILPTECSLLDGYTVEAQTVNCVLDRDGTFLPGQLEPGLRPADLLDGHFQLQVEQVGLVVRYRRVMRERVAYAEASKDITLLIRDVASAAEAAEGTGQTQSAAAHAALLREALAQLNKNSAAQKALSIVTKTMYRVWPDRKWYLHQETILVLGLYSYLTGREEITPLVINVPTAGGKTEAFLAVALWTVAYEALTSRRRGVALVKYPTLMLSTEQAKRMAQLAMAFDQEMENFVQDYRPRGIGLFFGKDKDFDGKRVVPNPRQHVGNNCLLGNCQKPWKSEQSYADRSGRELICAAGHVLRVATGDEVLYARPSLVACTTHKLVAKASNSMLRLLLGGEPYYCQHEGHLTIMPQCYQKGLHELRSAASNPQDVALVTAVILDEAHLIRESSGALASHFETHYLELMRELGGRYPVCMVSTATVAHVDNHAFHLGFKSKPRVFPGRDGENEDLYYAGTDEPQHVMLACVPRGRAIAWAMPHLVADYFDILEQGSAEGLDFEPLRPVMNYFGSYATQDQVQDGLRRRLGDLYGDQPGRRRLMMEEFSRRRFNLMGMDNVIRKVNSGAVDVIFSTNIASVGVDIEALRAIVFFGVPSNVSEFIQSLSRVARRRGRAGLGIMVHNPYLERDNSYYAYLYPFTQKAHRIVEAIPLNRYARQAINETFDTLIEAQLKHLWAPRIADKTRKTGRPLWILNAQPFGQALKNSLLSKDEVLAVLDRVYRADGDPSGAYPDRVRTFWSNFPSRVRTAQQAASNAMVKLRDLNVLHFIWSLIPQDEMGRLMFTGNAEVLRQAGAKALFSYEKNEEGMNAKVDDPPDSEPEPNGE